MGPALLALAGCRLGFDAVQLRPLYGYQDGCTDVTITGRAFRDDIRVTLGLKPVLGLTLPPVDSVDRGFLVSARTPPAEHQSGWVSLTVSQAGRVDVIEDAFWYTECPGAPHVDDLSVDAAEPQSRVELIGCALDADHDVRLIDPSGTVVAIDLDLAPVCTTARMSFGVPPLPPGTYQVTVVDAAGTTVWPPFCVEDTGDSGTSCEAPELLEILPVNLPTGGTTP